MQLELGDPASGARLSDAERLLRQLFGYARFRGRQAQAITAALDGRDALVLMPTGGGKSLCYQIPALLRDGVGVVVSPLIALMGDQVRALRELGIGAAFLNSTLSPAEQREIVEATREGRTDLLYIAPERLLQPRTLEWLTRLPVSLIAIDEAHCVSQWGHDFRQDYLALNRLREAFPGVPRMALTATATERTRAEILERLELVEPELCIGGFDRTNIRYTVLAKTDPRRQLARFLEPRRGEAGIAYCLSRKRVESVAEWLREQGFDALPYHAGLAPETRAAHQHRFLAEEAVVIVATIAFGMGIDKPDVRFVAHLDLPKSIESYYQETGRAGRDGEPAEAWMVYGLSDVVQLRRIVDESAADEEHKRHERHKLDALLGWCEITECRRRPLLAYFGERPADGPCGNCDNCLAPPATWDATEAARKLLSAVYRTGQRFGAAHLVDVLLGNETDKVAQHGHARLSVFGIGTELKAGQWRSVLRQLVVLGYLRPEAERFGALVLTPKSRPLLRGETSLQLREDVRAPRPQTRPERPAAPASVSAANEPLWQALRACRRRIAAEHGVPPYVVFHDKTLIQLAELRPRSLEEMLDISGIGQAKLERYGDRFLEVIRGHGV